MCCNRPRQTTSTAARYTTRTVSAKLQPRPMPPVQTRVPLSLPLPVFEYVGATALTLVSPITRKTYRFEKRGTRLAVDIRDRSWVAFVPNLVRVE